MDISEDGYEDFGGGSGGRGWRVLEVTQEDGDRVFGVNIGGLGWR